MVLHPRHRGDCAEFFSAPHDTAPIQFVGPCSAISALEHAAARAGRTWSNQFSYVLKLCLGYDLPDFDDGRSVDDWRTLLSPCRFRFSEAEAWTPCTRLWWKPVRKDSQA